MIVNISNKFMDVKEINENIGEIINALHILLSKEGLSLKKFGDKIGVSDATISKILNREVDVSPRVATKFFISYGYGLLDLRQIMKDWLNTRESP